jgi:WD40 repeat protein/tRNA A-37 threonylcarbamoyl transferase component Bud32
MAARTVHPNPTELAAFSLGLLSDEPNASLEAHIATCPICQAEIGETPADDRLIELLRSARSRLSKLDDATQGQTPTPPSAKEATISEIRTPVSPPPAEMNGPHHVDCLPPDLAGHDRYRIVRLLGTGGMGAVYEAEHRVMKRRVALKVIKSDFTASATAVERFRREVRAAARLTHPNIVATYDAEDAGATQFLVMEYAEGITLSQLVHEHGPLPVAEACSYVRDAAQGLQHAHEHGMVHRDVKPANLMRCASGTVKVLDFGLATLTAQHDEGLTDANAVMGTPNYMAPEQAESSHDADIRADVYSLGCTLYHLLTGNVPFPKRTTVQKILAHREQAVPSVRAVRPDVPPGLAVLVTRMLAKKPEDRYQTPRDVAAALEPFTRPAPAQPPRKRWPLARTIAATAFLAATVLAAIVVYRIETDRGELVIQTESDDVEVIVKQGGKVVEIIDTKTKKSITLHSGVYDLELKGATEGLKLDLDKATLTRNGTVLATIEHRLKPASPPHVETKTPGPKTPAPQILQTFGGIQILQSVPIPGRDNFWSSAALSPDGNLFAADVVENTIIVWDGKTGMELYRLAGWMCQITADGKTLLHHNFNGGKTLLIHDAATGTHLRSILFNKGLDGFRSLPDSRHAVAWTDGHNAHLCDLVSGKIQKSWTFEESQHPFGPFTDDGRILFVKSTEEKNYVAWDVQRNERTVDFAPILQYAHIHHILPGNKQAIVGGPEVGKVLLVDVADGKSVTISDGDWNPHKAVGVAMLDRRIHLFGHDNGRLSLYDRLSGKPLAAFRLPDEGKFGRGNPIELSPDGRYACVETDRSVYLLRLAAPPPVGAKTPSAEPPPPADAKIPSAEPPPPPNFGIQILHQVPIQGRDDSHSSATVSLDGKLFAADVLDGNIVVWDGGTGKECYRLGGRMCQFAPDGKILLNGSYGSARTLFIRDAATGNQLRSLAFKSGLDGFRALPSSRRALAWTRDSNMHLCDLESGQILKSWQFEGHPFGPFTDDGRILFLKPAGEMAYVAWDVQKNQKSAEFDQIVKYAHVHYILPGNKQAVVKGPEARKLLLVDVADGKSGSFPDGDWGPLKVIASPLLDPRIYLFGYDNAGLRQYDLMSGKMRAALQLPDGEKFGRGDPIGLSPHGRFACVQTDRSVYLLRMPEPEAAK